MKENLAHLFKGFASLFRFFAILIALNIPVVVGIFFINARFINWTALGFVYFLGVIIGYYILPMLLLGLLLSLLLAPVKPAARIIGTSAITLFIFYLFIDSLTYRIARVHIDLFWLEWILNDLAGFGLPPRTFVYITAAFLIFVALQIGLYKLAKKRERLRHFGAALALFAVVAFSTSQIIHVVAYENSDTRVTALTPYFPLYIPITSHSRADQYENFVPGANQQSRNALAGDASRTLTYPLTDITWDTTGGAAKPNILILLFESWRYDALTEKITPRTYELAQKSSIFTNHLSSGNQTTCGIFGLFYGLHASYWEAVKANNAVIDNPLLIDRLKKLGYEFGIYARSNFERHKVKDAIFRGVTVHEDFEGYGSVERDACMTEQLIGFIDSCTREDRPYLGMAFYKANHLPYSYPESHRLFEPVGELDVFGIGPGSDPTPYLNDYYNATHYVDSLIGSVIEHLRSLGTLNETIVIITTDHGEQFDDDHDNYWSHGTNFTRYQTQVPFILYWPGKEPREFTHRSSHVDLVPTLLRDVYGCQSPVNSYANGRHLYDSTAGPRPYVIGSYVNHAFIIEDNVYEIFPVYTKRYKLDNITESASPPNPKLLSQLLEEISRFSGPSEITKTRDKNLIATTGK